MDARRLSSLLQARGLAPKPVIDQVCAALAPGEHLADRLVADGHVREADLLHAVAHAMGARFVSSQKLEKLQLDRETLALMPLELCERHGALPVSWDRGQRSLTAVMADPSERGALGDEPNLERVEHLFVHVALPGAIAKAMDRCYRPRPAAPTAPALEPAPAGACELCGTPYAADQVECAQCGLMLEAQAGRASTGQAIVRALLADPTSGRGHPVPRTIHEAVTRVGFRKQVLDEHVPQLAADGSLLGSLSEFEAFVVSFIDGRQSIGQLAEATGLTNAEVRSIVASLEERGKLRLEAAGSQEPPPKARPPAAPPSATSFDVDEELVHEAQLGEAQLGDQDEGSPVQGVLRGEASAPRGPAHLGSAAEPQPASYFEIDAEEPEVPAPDAGPLAAPAFEPGLLDGFGDAGPDEGSFADVDPADVIEIDLPDEAPPDDEGLASAGSHDAAPGRAEPRSDASAAPSTDEALQPPDEATGEPAPGAADQDLDFVAVTPAQPLEALPGASSSDGTVGGEEGDALASEAAAHLSQGVTDEHRAAQPPLSEGPTPTDAWPASPERLLGADRAEPTHTEQPAFPGDAPTGEPLESEPPTQGMAPAAQAASPRPAARSTRATERVPARAPRGRPSPRSATAAPPSAAEPGAPASRTAQTSRTPQAHALTERRLPRVLSEPRASDDLEVGMPTQRRLTPVAARPAQRAGPTAGLRAAAARSPGVATEAPDETATPSNAVQAALQLERGGDVDGAIAVLRSAIAKSPRPAPLYNRLALILLSQKRDAVRARELLAKALELDPQNAAYAENLKRAEQLARKR